MGLVEFLTVIFVICKILGVGVIAQWSWLQVFLAEIIVVCVYLCMIIFGFFIAFKK